jgi:hypothetical protein
VLLPPKVVNCLWGLPEDQQQVTQAHVAGSLHPAADPGTSSSSPGRVSTSGSSSSRCSGRVYVKYKLLPKGEYVRFQPELRSFHEVVGSDPELLKASLEACLMGYCTLSEGDWVQVRGYRTHQHASQPASTPASQQAAVLVAIQSKSASAAPETVPWRLPWGGWQVPCHFTPNTMCRLSHPALSAACRSSMPVWTTTCVCWSCSPQLLCQS